MQTLTSYIDTLSGLARRLEVTSEGGTQVSLDQGADEAVAALRGAKAASRKVMLIGNGGSAAIASHLHNDLCKAVGVPALLFTEPSLLTALSNDDGYGSVFERPVRLWAAAGDVLLAISSSGRSENILRAVRAAKERQCGILTFSGFSPDNPLRRMGDLNFYVPSAVYGYVELAHSVLAHFLTDCAAPLTGGERG